MKKALGKERLKRVWVIGILILFGIVLVDMGPLLLGAENGNNGILIKGKLGEIVSQTPVGKGKGEIDASALPGFGGIPGAPRVNYPLVLLWGLWVGWIFTTVGAFGGVMAGVGHITLFGLGIYAASFQATNPALNSLLTDTIRVSNQYLVALAALISTYNFIRMKRIVLPLGILLGLGSIGGGLAIPWLTAGKIQLSEYIGYFGLVVLVVGGFLLYGTLKKKAEKTDKSGEELAKVQVEELSLFRIRLSFGEREYGFNPFLPLAGGFLIASISSFLGVGGGFLYVPFMTGLVGLPMYIVAGTSALAVLLSMITSIFSYVVLKSTFVSWAWIGVEMIGVFIGAMIGTRTQKYIPDVWLKRIFVLLAFYVGLRYFSKGFFGQSWLPPY